MSSNESKSKDFSKRFENILSHDVGSWNVNPFVNIETTDLRSQKELIKLLTYDILKASFLNGERPTDLWLKSTIIRFYPVPWTVVNNLLIPSPSFYLVHRYFSSAANSITKKK